MPAGLQQPSASQTHCPGQAHHRSHGCHIQSFPGLAAEHYLQAMSLHHQMSARNVGSNIPNQNLYQYKLVEGKAKFAPPVRLVWSMSSVPQSIIHFFALQWLWPEVMTDCILQSGKHRKQCQPFIGLGCSASSVSVCTCCVAACPEVQLYTESTVMSKLY